MTCNFSTASSFFLSVKSLSQHVELYECTTRESGNGILSTRIFTPIVYELKFCEIAGLVEKLGLHPRFWKRYCLLALLRAGKIKHTIS